MSAQPSDSVGDAIHVYLVQRKWQANAAKTRRESVIDVDVTVALTDTR